MADVTTPVPDATALGLLVAGRLLGFNLLNDTAGADAMGLVTASPAAFTLLGRLKAISDNTDGLESLVTATNTLLTTLGGYQDGQEGLLGDLRTLLTTQATYLDGLENLLTLGNGSAELVTPARRSFAIAKHDTTAITPLPRAVRVDVAGTVTYRTVDDTADVTMTALAGEVIQARVQFIRATGTSASGFLGFA